VGPEGVSGPAWTRVGTGFGLKAGNSSQALGYDSM
jgi:hypothetical protein